MRRDAPSPKYVALAVLLAGACGPAGPTGSNLTVAGDDQVLLIAMSEFGSNEDGSPAPLPAKLGILARDGDSWSYRSRIPTAMSFTRRSPIATPWQRRVPRAS